MADLQSTPIESPYHTTTLPESFHKSHDSAHAYPEVYHPPQTYEDFPEPLPDGRYMSPRKPVYEADPDPDLSKRENDPNAVPDKEIETRQICGLRRKVFFIVLAVVLLVAAIVGGVVGGVLGTRHNSSSSTDQNAASPGDSSLVSPSSSASSAAPSSTSGVNGTPETNTTVAAPSPIRAIAVAEAEVTMFKVWQTTDKNIHMAGYYNVPALSADAFELNLDFPAVNNTPIAALTWKYNDYFEIRIQYTAEGQSSLGSLNFRCYENGTLCTEPLNGLNSAIPAPIVGAGVALVTPELNHLRSYYIGSDGLVLEAKYTPEPGWVSPIPISNGAKAHIASPLGVTMVKDEIWLFWFSNQKQLQYATSTYTGSTWSVVQNISATIPEELPRSIGVVRSDAPDVTQVFYLDGTEMQQVQYSNNVWSISALGSSMPSSSISNGPLGAAGWDNTATRLYFVIDGSIQSVASESVYGQWQLGTKPLDYYGTN
ncbi:uncharacterized protein A1O9_08105 [Exophiala aquamarina CBS 119918]|uniref:Fucose-specific lectin n=1 Tax=Exophiala aquamarina CBS 119918 TaxID=1182545 RepID=A0A072PIM7_9EURO|nr:uncharacterized protein A1O9_08105 [Exophiala aquamarina CBS 119918]KEF55355.1 hypothetical protein A1O9_08105 [Exophiala aquamarina CBS 119918]